MTKGNKLRELLESDQVEFIMEAHNGLSAKIVEETGFKGIWGSGLSLSAAHGVRDNNELSYTDVINDMKYMSNATTIPILLDADTGYGNYNNFVQALKELIKEDVGGVAIEDKLFPKTNSFIDGENQVLADPDEFAGKIRAGRDYVESIGRPEFVIAARLESFITGLGLDDAIMRANKYAAGGADAILCHSKIDNESEVESFMNYWNSSEYSHIPVIIVPTKYYKVPVSKFQEMGISLVIWANHNMRSAITAMQATSKQIFEDQSLINVEEDVATLKTVFRLQNANELKDTDKKYLP